MSLKKLNWGLLVALSAIPCLAIANESSTNITLDTIHVQGSIPVKYGTTIDRKVSNNTTLSDFFQNAPNSTFVLDSSGKLSGVMIRGLGGQPDIFGNDSGQVKMTIDGIELPDALGFGHLESLGFSYFDPSTLSSLTVNRGPSFNSSTTAVGGIVALKTKEVEDILLPGRKLGFLFQAGHDNRYHSEYYTSAAAVKADNFSGLVQFTRRNAHESNAKGYTDVTSLSVPTASYQQALDDWNALSDDDKEDYRQQLADDENKNPEDYTDQELKDRFLKEEMTDSSGNDKSYYDNQTITHYLKKYYYTHTYSTLAKLNYDVDDNNRVSLIFDRYSYSRFEPFKANDLGTAASNKNTAEGSSRRDDSYRINVMLKGAHTFVDNKYIDDLDWYVARTDSLQVRNNYNFAPGYIVLGSEQFKTKDWHYNAVANKKLAIYDVTNNLTVGVNYANGDKYDEEPKYVGSKLSNLKRTELQSYFPRAKSIERSLFVNDRIQYKDLPVALNLGLKYSNFHSHAYKSGDPSFQFAQAQKLEDGKKANFKIVYTDRVKKFSVWDYSIGSTWRVNKYNDLTLTYAHANRLPNYALLNAVTYFHWNVRDNPDLKAENSNAISLGWNVHSKWYDQSIEYSYTRVRNKFYVELDDSRPDYGLNNEKSPATIRAVEYSGKVKFGGFTSVLDGLTLTANVSWAKGWDKEHHQPLTTVSPMTANVTLGYEDKCWAAFVRGNFAKAKYVHRIDLAGDTLEKNVETKGWGTMDLGVGFKVKENAKVNFTVYNAFNKRYQKYENVLYTNEVDRKSAFEPERAFAVDFSLKF